MSVSTQISKMYSIKQDKNIKGEEIIFCIEFLLLKDLLYPYKPSVLFVGHGQTVQTQIRHRIMRCLIRVSTVCLQNVILKF